MMQRKNNTWTKRVKHWLDRFKDVSSDMEDVLDDWEAAIHQSQSDGVESSVFGCVSMWEVCPFVSCFSSGSQVVMRHDIANRIKAINEEVDQIVKDKDKLELMKREIIKEPKRPESTSFVDVKRLLGRDAVKEDIIKTLLCEDNEEGNPNMRTFTILGMRGIGKTALAQLIYNDQRIQNHFNEKRWVSASNSFDTRQIAGAILESLDGASSISPQTSTQSLLSNICEKITAKKFFFILDDVQIEWDPLQVAFNNGMSGSWILVTTYKESVADKMISGSPYFISLELLSVNVCWSIIAQKAFTESDKCNRKNLEDIGLKIAGKCKGLPLAANTLGGLLRGKPRRGEWQVVLDSEIWNSDFAQEIFSALLLSYYDLPSIIRQCLSYCAIFPKNYEIHKDELIQHWMAQGYLNSADEVRRDLKGEDCFMYLTGRSFFQDFDKDSDGNIVCCKMHDLVHDFVQFLTENRFATERVQNLTLDLSTKKARHLGLVIENSSSSPMSIRGTENLRSLVAISEHIFPVTSEVLTVLFCRSNHLRLLKFDSVSLDAKEIARGIGYLIHLRCLCLISCFGLKLLPEAVCELPNLQSLNLQDCDDLEKLPVEIGKLINLRYLRIGGCDRLTFYPKGISKLTSLRRLTGIRMAADHNDAENFSFGDLENLDLLGGKLCVELIGNGVDCDEVKRAKLHKKIHLERIGIRINSPHIKRDEVLQALNPPSNSSVVFLDYNGWFKEGEILRRSRNTAYYYFFGRWLDEKLQVESAFENQIIRNLGVEENGGSFSSSQWEEVEENDEPHVSE